MQPLISGTRVRTQPDPSPAAAESGTHEASLDGAEVGLVHTDKSRHQ